MAENEPQANQGDPNNGQPANTDPQQATNAANSGQGSDQFDTSKLTDDQINKVLEDQRLWKTQRLSELREKAKKADTFEAEQKKRQEDEALKKGEHEKVIQAKETEIQELKQQITGSKIDNAITSAAVKAGAVDPIAVIKLIDKSGITINDDGTVTGVDQAMTALLESSPYLKNGKTPSVGNPTNPSGADTGIREFRSSQLKDSKFFKENEAEIMKAWAAGKIVNDEIQK